jgi:hypothetical protein
LTFIGINHAKKPAEEAGSKLHAGSSLGLLFILEDGTSMFL